MRTKQEQIPFHICAVVAIFLKEEILMNAISKQPEDEIEEALAYHQGDARATIAALLAEREFLLREIEYASLAMSYGFARGWKPGTGSTRQTTAR
jgi:hypothetical protein